jgi:2-(1,2-epoxy-1,2-dihydrophenyl)acetyl-CoA isomerase
MRAPTPRVPTQNLLVERLEGGIAALTLNRPDALNALSRGLLEELHAAFARVADDPGVRAVLLAGAGKAFCAGADLSPAGADGADLLGGLMNPLVLAIRRCPVPVVCAVQGAVAGGGAGLALSADVVLAARSAYFYIPQMSRLGLLRLGPARATALSLTGERLPAPQAVEWGLIWRCCEDAQLAHEALAIARQLAQGPAHAAVEMRQAFEAARVNDLAAQLDHEAQRQHVLGAREAFREGVQAFREKRVPRFPPRAPTR